MSAVYTRRDTSSYETRTPLAVAVSAYLASPCRPSELRPRCPGNSNLIVIVIPAVSLLSFTAPSVVANNTKETFALTWLLACLLIAGDAIIGRSVDWQIEATMADRIHTTKEAVYQAVGNSVEDLVSLSIHSGVKGDLPGGKFIPTYISAKKHMILAPVRKRKREANSRNFFLCMALR